MMVNLVNRAHLYAFGLGWTIWIAKPAAAPSGGLFMRQPNLNGISVGGPFFANPIG